MKNSLFLVCFFLLVRVILCAQSDAIPLGMVVYSHQVHLSTDNENNGFATLFFNATNSLYVHNSAPPADSVVQEDDYSSKFIKGDAEGFPIYKSHASRQALSKIPCFLSPNHCLVSDTLGDVQWTLEPERKRLAIYECRRATGTFRGRQYEAWYAVDIPVSSGPYKFAGLPGLILEVRTLDGKVEFLFQKLEFSPDWPAIIQPPHGKETGWTFKEYIQARNENGERIEKEFRAKGVDITVTVNPDSLEIFDKQ